MMVAFQYPEDKVLLYEDRGWTPYGRYGFDSGNAFYGTEGFMVFSRRGYFQVYLGKKEEKGPGMRGGIGKEEHFCEFPGLCAFAQAAQRLGRGGPPLLRPQTIWARSPTGPSGCFTSISETETILNDPEANALLTKEYREPWSV